MFHFAVVHFCLFALLGSALHSAAALVEIRYANSSSVGSTFALESTAATSRASGGVGTAPSIESDTSTHGAEAISASAATPYASSQTTYVPSASQETVQRDPLEAQNATINSSTPTATQIYDNSAAPKQISFASSNTTSFRAVDASSAPLIGSAFSLANASDYTTTSSPTTPAVQTSYSALNGSTTLQLSRNSSLASWQPASNAIGSSVPSQADATNGTTTLLPTNATSDPRVAITSAETGNVPSQADATNGTTTLLPTNATSDPRVAITSAETGNVDEAPRSGLPPLPTTWLGNVSFPNSTAYTNGSATIEPTGSGFEYASRCALLSSDYYEASLTWGYTAPTSAGASCTYYSTPTTSYTNTLYSEPTSTFCRGASRVLAGGLSAVETNYLGASITRCYRVVSQDPYPEPTPACSYGVDDCNSLWMDYDSSTKSMRAMTTDAVLPLTPMCSSSLPNLYCSQCTIGANTAELFYWPPDIVGDGPCDATRSFRSATPTITGQPNTAVVDGTTYTSPSIYISIDAINAWSSDFRNPCGGTVYSTVLSMNPEDLSSLRTAWYPTATDYTTYTLLGDYDIPYTSVYADVRLASDVSGPYPFDYGDLMGAVPLEAYNGTWDAIWNYLPWGVIDDTRYQPVLLVPPQVRNMDPDWKYCDVELQGVWDPPLPLRPVSTVNGVSTAVVPASTTSVEANEGSTTAEPASQATTPYAESTTTSKATTTPIGQQPASSPTEVSGESTAQDSVVGSTPSNSRGISPVKHSTVADLTAGGSEALAAQPTTLATSKSSSSDPVKVIISIISQIAATPGGASPVDTSSEGSVGDPVGSFVGVGIGLTSIAESSQSGVMVTIGSQTFTAKEDGTSVMLQNGALTTTLQAGAAPTLAGHVLSVPALVSSAALGGSGATPGQGEAGPSAVLITIGTRTLTAEQSGSAIVIADASLTTTLLPGSAAIIDGYTVSDPLLPSPVATLSAATSAGLAAAGTTVVLNPAGQSVSITLADGSVATAAKQDGNVLLKDASGRTTVLSNGDIAVIADSIVSVTADGGSIVVTGAQGAGSLDTSPPTVITLPDGRTISAVQQDQFVVLTDGSGQSISVSFSSTATFAGQTLQVAADGSSITVNGLSTVPLQSQLPVTTITLADGTEITARLLQDGSVLLTDPSGNSVSVGGGSTTDFAGHTFALSSDGASITVDGTSTLPLTTVATTSVIITADGKVFTASQHNGIVILTDSSGNQVAMIPGSSMFVDGHAIEVAADDASFTIDGKTSTLTTTPRLTNSIIMSDGAVFNFANQAVVIVLTDASEHSIRLPYGSLVTWAGHTFAIVSDGSHVIVDGVGTIALSAPPSSGASITLPDGRRFSASSVSGVITLTDNEGHTLRLLPGSSVTWAGHIFSASHDGSYIVIDGAHTMVLGNSLPTPSKEGLTLVVDGQTVVATEAATMTGHTLSSTAFATGVGKVGGSGTLAGDGPAVTTPPLSVGGVESAAWSMRISHFMRRLFILGLVHMFAVLPGWLW